MDFGNLKRVWQLCDGKKLGDGMKLGQYIGDFLQFERDSLSQSRTPTFSVLAEMFGDITDDVRSVGYERRSEDSLGEPNYGTGELTLIDQEGKYIENGMSLFRKGKRVYIFAGFNDRNIPRFGGVIRDIYVNSDAREMTLTLAEDGYKLRTSQTSGDYSGYETPKKLIDQICAMANIAAPEYENETGQPSVFEFGYTDLKLRSLWAIIHGSAFCISYKQIFDETGRLNLFRSTTFDDTGYPGVKRCWTLGDGKTLGDSWYLKQIYSDKTDPVEYNDEYTFDDSNIEWIVHRQLATLINKKTIDFMQCIRPEFTAGDGVRAGQHTRTKTHSLSKHKYGENVNQETDELIGSWKNAGQMIDQNLDEYPWPRGIYEMRTKAIPQLQINDRFYINNEDRNIAGYFKIMGINETLTPGSYDGVFTIISEGERF